MVIERDHVCRICGKPLVVGESITQNMIDNNVIGAKTVAAV